MGAGEVKRNHTPEQLIIKLEIERCTKMGADVTSWNHPPIKLQREL